MEKNKFYSNGILNENGCLEWKRYINKHGYGYIFVKGKSWSIHRYSYFLTYGKIPKEKWILHKCDNRKCINPNHLYLGDNAQNVKDRVSKNRSAIAEKNKASKLTIEQVKNIKILLRDGVPGLRLAKQYKMSQATIAEIKRNEIWKHVILD